jgi:homoserine O-succinyltransferase
MQAISPVKPCVIGLVNNMAATGRAAAYAQFSAALAEAGYPFKLRHFTLQDASDLPPDCISIDKFSGREISAFIVTGTEPLAEDLRDEWFWERLTGLHDWCEQNSIPVIWSCLSAHAAVLHSDRVNRLRQDTKLSGIFRSTRVASQHPLMKSMPKNWAWPHSRYNTLPEGDLVTKGYTILSRAGAAGVDIFARTDGTPFFYLQGHPEYQPDTLLREYARDMRRFASGRSTLQPAMPTGYIDGKDACTLAALDRMGETFFDGAASGPLACIHTSWQKARRQLFKNWLDIVYACAENAVKPSDTVPKTKPMVHAFGAAGA